MKRKVSLISISLLYILAGINHFINTTFYLKIMPDYIPVHEDLVLLSGVLEVIFGLLVLLPQTRWFACWAIILMLIAFLPVHIQMIIDNYAARGILFWIAILRLPLQYVLIRWAYKLRNIRIKQHKINNP